jgi:hypothetical protein
MRCRARAPWLQLQMALLALALAAALAIPTSAFPLPPFPPQVDLPTVEHPFIFLHLVRESCLILGDSSPLAAPAALACARSHTSAYHGLRGRQSVPGRPCGHCCSIERRARASRCASPPTPTASCPSAEVAAGTAGKQTALVPRSWRGTSCGESTTGCWIRQEAGWVRRAVPLAFTFVRSTYSVYAELECGPAVRYSAGGMFDCGPPRTHTYLVRC